MVLRVKFIVHGTYGKIYGSMKFIGLAIVVNSELKLDGRGFRIKFIKDNFVK